MDDYIIQIGNLEILNQGRQRMYRCAKCGLMMCSMSENYKKYAMKHDATLTKGQPDYLASKTDGFVLREYYCPKCGALFEVNMVEKHEDHIWSVQLQ